MSKSPILEQKKYVLHTHSVSYPHISLAYTLHSHSIRYTYSMSKTKLNFIIKQITNKSKLLDTHNMILLKTHSGIYPTYKNITPHLSYILKLLTASGLIVAALVRIITLG